MKDLLSHAFPVDVKTIVIKIGSALLIDNEHAEPRYKWMDSIAQDVAKLRECGLKVCLVSSGSVAIARKILNLEGELSLPQKQAAAAVGQIKLAQAWEDALGKYNMIGAQVLLTAQEMRVSKRYRNGEATLKTLLEMGCVPVVNENDTISNNEIRFGDNDRLAAWIARMVDADALVLLSDIDGLYTANPKVNKDARHLPYITELNEKIMKMGGKAVSSYSAGGMRTKLLAAKIAMDSNCAMVIARGEECHPIQHLIEGGKCSWFVPQKESHVTREMIIEQMPAM